MDKIARERQRAELSKKAHKWLDEIRRDDFFEPALIEAYNNSLIYRNLNYENVLKEIPVRKVCEHTKVEYRNQLVDTVLKECGDKGENILVLNFADFTRPGGLFLEGSPAQEEALCHISGLYPILNSLYDDYYALNESEKHGGLYTHSFILSPNVPFEVRNSRFYAGVITCAAPNCTREIRYNKGVNIDEYKKAIKERAEILYLMCSHAYDCVDTIILGAWGCGVFKNDPEWVAQCWDEITKKYDGIYKRVIHPVPVSSSNQNSIPFEKLFRGDK